jgi:hypothetical protein
MAEAEAVAPKTIDRKDVRFLGIGIGWILAAHMPTGIAVKLDRPVRGEEGKLLLIAMLKAKANKAQKRKNNPNKSRATEWPTGTIKLKNVAPVQLTAAIWQNERTTRKTRSSMQRWPRPGKRWPIKLMRWVGKCRIRSPRTDDYYERRKLLPCMI